MEYRTKRDFISAYETYFLNPVREELLSCEGHPHFGDTAAVYNQDAVYAEAYLRHLWGLVPYWRGGHGDEALKAGIRHGLVCGTDPTHPHYWGVCGHFDQRFVEMAPLATGLLYVPEILWEPLSDTEKQKLWAWMWQINEHNIPDNNWRFFRILTNLAFKHLGMQYSAARLDEDRERLEEFYRGNGWYSDGAAGQKDYYVAWAFHYYGLLYACFEEDAYAARYRERAAVFAKAFIHWFSDGGASLPYGRSLTYRLAQGSFWSTCALAGIDTYDYGVVKGILSRHLSDWLSAPIFDRSGALSIGFKYPNLIMGEHYNAPGSPYWGMKFFAHLALPDDHPFWAAEISPMPPLENKRLLREANMLVTRHNGDVFAYAAATIERAAFGQVGAKYLKFAYSTRFGFNLKMGDSYEVEGIVDSMLTFHIGGVLCERRTTLGYELSEDKVIVRWSPMDGIIVTTESIPDEHGHTRRHMIESAYACTAYDSGFAVASRDEDHCVQSTAETSAEARNDFSVCRVIGGEGCEPMVIIASPNSNVLYNKSVIPVVKYTIPQGHSEIVTRIEVE